MFVVKTALKQARRGFLRVAVFTGFILSLPVQTLADQSVTLAWDPSPDPNVVGYNIYSGTTSSNLALNVSVGNVTIATIPGFQEGMTYFFFITAVNSAGLESLPSNEVSYTIPGVVLSIVKAPVNGFPNALLIAAQGTIPAQWTLEASSDLRAWHPLAAGTNPIVRVTVVFSATPAMFYRLNSETPNVRLSMQRNQPGGFPNSLFTTSTGTVPSAWTLETSTNCRTWSPLASGANSPVYAATITSVAPPRMFFRLTGP